MSFNKFSVSLFNYVKFVSGFGFELIAVDGLVLLLFIFGVLSLQNSASLQNIIDGQRRILMVELFVFGVKLIFIPVLLLPDYHFPLWSVGCSSTSIGKY